MINSINDISNCVFSATALCKTNVKKQQLTASNTACEYVFKVFAERQQ